MTSPDSAALSARKWLPFEPGGRDFPFYRDDPGAITGTGWLLVLAGVAAGFIALVAPLPFVDGLLTGWLRAILFAGLPLLALRAASPTGWRAIFARVGLRDVGLMLAFALINILVTLAVGAAVKSYAIVSPNAAIADAANLGGIQLVNFFSRVALQLLGEELITILPFLALTALCYRRLQMGRRASVLVAWLASAIAFGLIHLPTYDWNVVQCLVVIGSARLVLTWAYIWSKNIWVSVGAHIINDFTLIGATVFLAPLAAAS